MVYSDEQLVALVAVLLDQHGAVPIGRNDSGVTKIHLMRSNDHN